MDTASVDVPPTVQELLVRVMQDVDVITKDDRNTTQGYQFRGVDATMNTVGPILRKHGLVCLPTDMFILVDKDVPTQRGGTMRSVTVQVTWVFIGPAGDELSVVTLGESADTGDKAIPKATSVAYRELWLKTLCVPTQDPSEDVDKSPSPERGVATEPLQVDPATASRLEKEVSARRSEEGYKKSWANVATAYNTGELTTEDYSRLTELISAKVQAMRQEQKSLAAASAALEEETRADSTEDHY